MSLDLFNLAVWIGVGVVAGFLASRLALGHGLGLLGNLVIGVLGAVLGNILVSFAGLPIVIWGHPVVSEIVVAAIGAAILLIVLRGVGLGRGRRRRTWLG